MTKDNPHTEKKTTNYQLHNFGHQPWPFGLGNLVQCPLNKLSGPHPQPEKCHSNDVSLAGGYWHRFMLDGSLAEVSSFKMRKFVWISNLCNVS